MLTKPIPDALQGSAIERVVPGSPALSDHLLREHMKRYLFATPLVSGMNVLDLACGSGYGSYQLSLSAKQVLGVDVEGSAIEYARNNYKNENLSFLTGNAQELSGLNDASFDAVVSFETIEHLPDYKQYLKAVRRVLKPGGLFIVSTPDTEFTKKTHLPKAIENPYHVHEFTFDELKSALSEFFSVTHFYGQQFYISPSPARKMVHYITHAILATRLYQSVRNLIPKIILTSFVKITGVVNEGEILPLNSANGVPEILIAVCL